MTPVSAFVSFVEVYEVRFTEVLAENRQIRTWNQQTRSMEADEQITRSPSLEETRKDKLPL